MKYSIMKKRTLYVSYTLAFCSIAHLVLSEEKITGMCLNKYIFFYYQNFDNTTSDPHTYIIQNFMSSSHN